MDITLTHYTTKHDEHLSILHRRVLNSMSGPNNMHCYQNQRSKLKHCITPPSINIGLYLSDSKLKIFIRGGNFITNACGH